MSIRRMFLALSLAMVTVAATLPAAGAVPVSCTSLGRPVVHDTLVRLQFRQMGLDARAIGESDGCIQALVRNANGQTTLERFDPRSLIRL